MLFSPLSINQIALLGSLDPEKVKDKIVFCLRGKNLCVEKALEVNRAGTAVASNDTTIILAYINSTSKPLAQIVPAKTVLGTKPNPFMATFSSRGPNLLDPNVLKPDITAPGITALLKAIHPDWNPAATRSAIMTTAVVTKNKGSPMTDAFGIPATPFNYGSGQLNPNQASDPGLLYDAKIGDYLIFLCSSGINASNTLNTTFKCPENPPKSYDLNYPSIAIANLTDTENITRTMTNVGGKSEYTVSVDEPPGVSVNIHPNKLSFQISGEKQTFTVQLTLRKPLDQEYVFGSYTWNDGIHKVRSPIAVSAT
ncbi:hypothetical protein SUGI_0703080 [Cryptomeria japonica]|nr:hypothetical protein SUGI_0703080 [Cryptomeria japonica]